ncbi:glycoside hydrolase family 13 protein [Lacticaseibacillus absianus]|uniref:glycoside hydrolase family 13 protein n=1 Tax=Lacticaseibacillus absianus TaxID=2729623 RepID=UPI0015CDE127|nr:alpha-glucosidase [Lacticaseibacillus absianus]
MQKHWWQEAVVYQVYPRSFQDSDDDGLGDLNGLRRRLPYIKRLGADVIWLTPVYRSPDDDNGYDISDYESIQPAFGTMADFDAVLADAHALGLKIVMDLVVNHTSDEHAWFAESRKAVDNPYRDYYIWRDPVDGHEPAPWSSTFSGSAWEFDEATGQYYLHLFSKKQPDLNWRNDTVRDEIYGMMTRWLDRGIDGFRMDVINSISKPEDFTNTRRGDDRQAQVHAYLREMNDRVLSKYDIMTVGETGGVTPESAQLYAGYDTHELSMVFQFQHLSLDLDREFGRWRHHPIQLSRLKAIMTRWQVELAGKAWNSLFWSNHDQPRAVSRWGNDRPLYRELSAKMLGAVLHYQQGTPYIYQGEELGMTNVYNVQSIDDCRDIETLNAWQDLVETRHLLAPDEMLLGIELCGRDNARTPMQWDTSANAGFTSAGVTPWIGLNDNYPKINAASQVDDPNSVFSFYREMNALRKQYPIITYGDYTLLAPEDEQVWAYTRTLDGQVLTVVANFTDETLTRPEAAPAGTLLQQNYGDDAGERLRPYEVKVYLK